MDRLRLAAGLAARAYDAASPIVNSHLAKRDTPRGPDYAGIALMVLAALNVIFILIPFLIYVSNPSGTDPWLPSRAANNC